MKLRVSEIRVKRIRVNQGIKAGLIPDEFGNASFSTDIMTSV